MEKTEEFTQLIDQDKILEKIPSIKESSKRL